MVQSMTNDFSLVRGGPAYTVQAKLGLLSDDGLPAIRGAVAVAMVAWLPLALLTLYESRSFTGEVPVGFFSDLDTYIRFLFATFALIIIDRTADKRVNRLLDGFTDSGIVDAPQQAAFSGALSDADRRSASGIAEAIILGLAVIMGVVSASHIAGLDAELWMRSTDGSLSHAGKWSALISTPVYFFLVLRWLWRFVVWSALLSAISRLPLRLVPTHPDRCGGIGFLALFPQIFTPLAFILSVDIAATCFREVLDDGMTFEVLRAIWLIWTLILVILFVGPLATFSRKLIALREHSIIEFSALLSRIKREAERVLVRDELDTPVTISAMSDIDPAMEIIQGIRVIPVAIWAIIPLILSSLLPFLVAATALVPLGELLKRLAALIR